MTVNIPGINPRNIFFIFNNIKVYIIEHYMFPRSQKVKTTEQNRKEDIHG
jgi:hypothetical protein